MNMLNTDVWAEPGGPILKEALRLEARTLHQMHQPPARMRDWLAMRKRLTRLLLDAAGTFPAPPNLDVREHGSIEAEGYRIIKLSYQSRPGLRVTALLYRPDGPGRFPAVLNMHGHWHQGKIAATVAGRCQVLAKEGFVVLSPDAIGAGERGTRAGEFEYHGHHQSASLLSAGETLLGMQLNDNMRGLDLLESLEFVDGTRIGATGASGGGNQTLWLSALDPRVKASVPVVSIGTFESYVTNYNCWCETLPGGLEITETWGALGLIAPNPLLILTAAREKNPAFLPGEMLRSYAAAQKIYGLYGAADRISCQAVDLPHGYLPEMQRHMLGWFKYWLMGEGTPLPRALPAVPEFPERELMCFPGKTRPPAEIKSLLAYSSLRTVECKKTFLSQPRLNRGEKLRSLRQILRLSAGMDRLKSSEPSCEENDGLRIERFSVESEPNVLIPCVLISHAGAKPATITLAVHGGSKAACLKESAVQAILRGKGAVCLMDLRHTGETKWDFEDFTDDLGVARAALWLGHTMIGQWVKDLFAVRAALTMKSAKSRVGLLAFEEAAVAALAAAALEKKFFSVKVERLLASYVITDSPLTQRYSIYLPGMLQWGDISLLAALANCPLEVASLSHPSGKALTPKERASWLREVREMAKRLGIRSSR
jgi:hypothetical protein